MLMCRFDVRNLILHSHLTTKRQFQTSSLQSFKRRYRLEDTLTRERMKLKCISKIQVVKNLFWVELHAAVFNRTQTFIILINLIPS